jgi:hypothetical protein
MEEDYFLYFYLVAIKYQKSRKKIIGTIKEKDLFLLEY